MLSLPAYLSEKVFALFHRAFMKEKVVLQFYKKLILINEFGRMGLNGLAANALQISMRYLMEYDAHFINE